MKKSERIKCEKERNYTNPRPFERFLIKIKYEHICFIVLRIQ